MKKLIVILFLLSVIYISTNKDEIIIPSDSIRFRIIANSNSLEDQALKNKIKDDLVLNIFSNIKTKEDIENNISNIKKIVDKYNVNYDLNYGKNYFPKKTYKGVTYPSGNYDSLVVTINQGLGNNYWCVLYPPLCFIEEKTDTDTIQYQFMIKNIIDNYNK